MKHPILFVLSLIIFVSCNSKNAYDLTGETQDPSLDGKQISIMTIARNDAMTTIDSAIIKNGKFRLQGKVDSAEWYMLVINQTEGNTLMMKDFYIEGKLNVKLVDHQFRITGGPVNDAYQAFEDQYMAMSKDLLALNQQIKADPANGDLKKLFSDAYQTFEINLRKASLEAIKANINNAAGIHILKSTAPTLEDADLESILAMGDEAFLQDPFIQELEKQLKQAKRVAIGNSYVDLAMLSPEGDTVTLSNYAGNGNYVLIDFWASWCGPCIRELPNVLACYNKFHAQGFDVVGVSLDESGDDWKAAIQKYQLPWHQMSDLAGWRSTAVSLYAFSSIPHTVLLDPNGIILEKNLRGAALEEKLNELYAAN